MNVAGNFNKTTGTFTHAGGTVNLLGGKLTLGGNSAGDTTETIANLGLITGGSRIELTRSGTRQLTLAITNLAAPSNGSLVITGLAGSAQLSVTNANLVAGQGLFGYPHQVRGDVLVDDSVSGEGDGFLALDGANWRALENLDLNGVASSWSEQENAYLSGNESLRSSVSVNTLTTDGFSGGNLTSSLSSGLQGAFGGYGMDASQLTLTLANASAILVKNGTVNVDVALRGSSSQAAQFHILGDATLELNGQFGLGSSVGFVKAGEGTMNLNARAGFTGVVTVNGGDLNLSSGADNTIAVGETVGAARVSDLQLNGLLSVVDVNNRSQVIGALTSANTMSGSAGTIRNLGPTVVTLTCVVS
jgi:autotransporter-associated beta strand protein